MRSYLELARINARHNKRQSRMTILCIILAVFLVTSVFSMVDFEYIHMKDKLIRDHGNWHIMLVDVPMEEAREVSNEVEVNAACRYDTLNYDLDGKFYFNHYPLCVIGTEPSFFSDMMVDTLTYGSFPRTPTEIVLSESAGSVFGCKLGDSVVLNTPAGDYSYTVSGFCTDTSNSLASGAVIGVLDYPAFDTLARANGQTREPGYFIQFENNIKIKNTIAQLKSAHGWEDGNVSENTALLGIMGISSDSYVVGLYAVGAVLVALVVLAGVFMISGSMNTNIAERTQFFGMLRCIGASKRQVRRLVRFEALHWLKLALPIGIGGSVLACWAVCAVLAYGIGGEWQGMPVGRISFIGIALGALMGLITVLLSASAPAKRAAKVSPISAVAKNQDSAFSGKSFNSRRMPVDRALGVHHAFTRKKSLLLMTGSFALSIILFLFFSVMLEWISNALTTTKPYTPQLSVYTEGYAPSLSHALADELRGIEGVKHVYGRMHVEAPAEAQSGETNIDLISYDDTQFKWAKKDLIRGDVDKVKNEAGSVMTVYSNEHPIRLGDSFTMNGKTLTVAAVLSDSPFEVDEVPTLICSEDTFRAFAGDMNYSVIDLQLEKNAGEDTVAAIRSLLGEGMILVDIRASIAEVNSTYLAFSVLVYLFLGLVTLISVLNIINSISMSVTAKSREYGMMRAIGLSRRQLVQMIRFESLSYAGCGILAGCALGIPLNAWFYTLAISRYWGTPWRFPVVELLIVLAVVLLSSFAAVRGPARALTESSITDILN